MRTSVSYSLFLIPMLLGLTLVPGDGPNRPDSQDQTAILRAMAGPPPASLDAFYPPKAKGPQYLMEMFSLATPMAGLAVDLGEGEPENAAKQYAALRENYGRVAKLVPEWEAMFPLAPIEALGTALKAGDKEKVMPALQAVGAVCENCHMVNMPKAQYKYHWDEFEKITVTDPVTQQDLDWKTLMLQMEFAFAGIGIDMQEGQPEKALQQFTAFKKRFAAMKENCSACHQTERAYYVDSRVESLIDTLGTALQAAPPDAKTIAAMSEQIGMESCGKCHLVHIPAGLTRRAWQQPIFVGKQ